MPRLAIDTVEKLQISGASRICSHLGESPGIEIFNHCQDLFCATRIDQINCALTVQHRMSRMKPNPSFICGIEVAQTIDDVSELCNYRLGAKIGRGLPTRPARDRCRRNRNDVGNIFPLQAAVVPEVLKNSADGRALRQRPTPMFDCRNGVRGGTPQTAYLLTA